MDENLSFRDLLVSDELNSASNIGSLGISFIMLDLAKKNLYINEQRLKMSSQQEIADKVVNKAYIEKMDDIINILTEMSQNIKDLNAKIK